jgi:hypothetical protein
VESVVVAASSPARASLFARSGSQPWASNRPAPRSRLVLRKNPPRHPFPPNCIVPAQRLAVSILGSTPHLLIRKTLYDSPCLATGGAVQVIPGGQLIEPFEIPRPKLSADSMPLFEPLPKIQETAAFGTERTNGTFQPRSTPAALGTGNFWQWLGRLHRFNPRSCQFSTRLSTKQVTTGK